VHLEFDARLARGRRGGIEQLLRVGYLWGAAFEDGGWVEDARLGDPDVRYVFAGRGGAGAGPGRGSGGGDLLLESLDFPLGGGGLGGEGFTLAVPLEGACEAQRDQLADRLQVVLDRRNLKRNI